MARHNNVILFGRIVAEPKIVTRERADGEVSSVGRIMLNVVRRYNKEGAHMRRIDTPPVETSDPNFIELFKTLHENDVVEVKGLLRTKPVYKRAQCNHCEQFSIRNGVKSFIHPLDVRVFKRGLTKEEAAEYVNEHSEVSNMAYILGYLCKDPEYYKDPNRERKCVVTYNIAVDRKVRLQDDNTNDTADFIWIRSYGDTGEQDYRRLHTGSCIVIDGYVQTKVYKSKRTCEHCGSTFEIQDGSIEVVPISNEYCNNFRTVAETEEFCRQKRIAVDPTSQLYTDATNVFDAAEESLKSQEERHQSLVNQGDSVGV